MAERLDGTVALITGASSGIGEATARALAQQGAAVAVVARRKERLDQLATGIIERNGRALVIETDVTDQTQAQAAVEAARLDLSYTTIRAPFAGARAGAARAAPAPHPERPEPAYLKQVNKWRPPSDPQLLFLLMAQFANAGRHAEGIDYFNDALKRASG